MELPSDMHCQRYLREFQSDLKNNADDGNGELHVDSAHPGERADDLRAMPTNDLQSGRVQATIAGQNARFLQL